ncbi:cytochrome-c oxidase, cbb3-type subunit III [Pontibaca methylaminivorans]|uniref:Cbb3-type cytochrome c oxidase subunit n=1 Tax=Pontibaca methylaminivorans TaxID=515897 RepID=A0A1R3WEM6_9RHOB|nr:cytochrome-c oxidase, cbb3-type subunit III [Pontibaca methylaminivorans]SIT76641.1 cytochrome c oxidase cbb3-type subunit 3 [Pontibaca methylaminivorans]
MSDKQIDDVTGVSTTGHEWDGIKELDNPMPRWWLWVFYATVVWAVGYAVAYPAWPLINSATSGLLGYSSRAEMRAQLDAIEAEKSGYLATIADSSMDEILADDALYTFAVSAGAAAFRVNCVQCHGTGAQGSAGYPNLNDDVWIWGGTAEDIRQTIAHGVRFEQDDDTRFSEMPAFGDMLDTSEINQVATFVASLSGEQGDADAEDMAAGAEVYADNCSVCHGETGEGDRNVGAPALNHAIWLYGSSVEDIARQVRNPRHGVMPAWQARLGDATVKELAAYVHSLGGGE